MTTGLLAVLLAYALGSIPFGYLIVRFTQGKDVRAEGSGNIGATNVLRTGGTAAGIATLVLDLAKGFAAAWLAGWLSGGSVFWISFAAVAVMLGHAFPVFLKFQGGKAVATSIGAFLYFIPLPVAAIVLVFAIVVAATRQVSAGSVVGAATFPLGVWLIEHPEPPVLLAAIIAGAFIVYRHKGNLERIKAGTEPSFHWK